MHLEWTAKALELKNALEKIEYFIDPPGLGQIGGH